MYFCLRVDLDYVPWDTPDAQEFGHGEPAAFLRILELGNEGRRRFQFFASTRVIRAFPAVVCAVLEEGHDLDWLCKHPDVPQARFEQAQEAFLAIENPPLGFAVKGAWLAEYPAPDPSLRFLSAHAGETPPGVATAFIAPRADREAVRQAIGVRKWGEDLKAAMRQAATRNQGVTVSVRPQVLAKFDPKLSQLRELVEFADATEMPTRTLREVFVNAK